MSFWRGRGMKRISLFKQLQIRKIAAAEAAVSRKKPVSTDISVCANEEIRKDSSPLTTCGAIVTPGLTSEIKRLSVCWQKFYAEPPQNPVQLLSLRKARRQFSIYYLADHQRSFIPGLLDEGRGIGGMSGVRGQYIKQDICIYCCDHRPRIRSM